MNGTIYMYHRIVPNLRGLPTGYHRADLAVPVDEFVSHLRWLRQTSAVVGLCELASSLSNTRPVTRRSCALTFDDGFVEHFRWVMPVLDDFGFTATFFVNGNCWPHLRRPRWLDVFYALGESASHQQWVSYFALTGRSFDLTPQSIHMAIDALKLELRAMGPLARDTAIQELAERLHVVVDERNFCDNLYLEAAMLKEMHGAGMTIGAHTLTHPELSRISLVDAKREILGSVKLISELTGERAIPFAYPFGGFGSYNAEIVSLVVDAGCPCACTGEGGVNTPVTSPFELRRVRPSSARAFGGWN